MPYTTVKAMKKTSLVRLFNRSARSTYDVTDRGAVHTSRTRLYVGADSVAVFLDIPSQLCDFFDSSLAGLAVKEAI